ncbi:histidine phosphatase family protein [Paenibacillus polygoni]|uniref:Histidine phosphatase family protein n=1 Tax=Paenibacillus polygoni TaxID=3050112 RepID=A0ABY8XCC8_9BACL|nr:histidine phosphatase family protein [Paenibacillus polygoni]WIV20950.1 histidine phosphatase family protein [Paenibacillus polygoni]
MISTETHIYMVRHAESIYIHGEARSRGLTEKGLEYARCVANVFSGIKVDLVASSPYRRAIQTVQYVAEQKGLSIVEYENLRERLIKGPLYEEKWEVVLEAIKTSFDDKDYALDGGESTKQAQKRSIPVLELLLKQYAGKHVVMGTNGNIMTLMMNYYDSNYGFSFWKQTTMPDIYHLIFRDMKLTKVERIWNTPIHQE